MSDVALTDNMFGPPSLDLRLLYDEHQTQTSAMLELQWCLGPKARQFLKTADSKYPPLLFVCVISPKGREERYLFDLLNGLRGVIEFYCPGDHKIYGKVFYGYDRKKLARTYLRRETRTQYSSLLDEVKGAYSPLGDAEIEIEVMAGDFFAKEPSPQMDWFVDLWHSQPWIDQCEFTRRKWVIGPFKLLAVLAVAVFQAMLRFLVAFWYGFLLAERGIEWDTIWHPFIYSWKNVRESADRKPFQRNLGSALFYDKKGKSREFLGAVLWCCMPILHVIGFLVTMIVLANHLSPKVKIHAGQFLLHALVAYGEFLLEAIGAVVLIGIVGSITIGIGLGFTWCLKRFDKRYPKGTTDRALGMTSLKWAAAVAFVAFAFYERQHIPSAASVTVALAPWARAVLHLLIWMTEIVVGVAALLLLWRAIPAQGKSVIKGTLRDGFVAIAEDLWTGGQYCVEGWAAYLNERASRLEKEEKVRAQDIYAFLACEQSPETGTGIRRTLPSSVSLNQKGRLFIQGIKLKHCRPRAR